MLKFKNRIRLNKDFQAIFKNGQSFYYQGVNCKIKINNLKNSRFGIIVSNKISKKAVERNRLKRLFREVIKDNLPLIKKNQDFVIIIKTPNLFNKNKVEINYIFQTILQKSNNL